MADLFENNDIFKTMHPVKLQVMKELVEKTKGKQMKDVAPHLMEATRKLKQHNLSFTPEEVSVLIEYMTKDMTPAEKAKVEMMKNIIRKKR